MCLNSTLSASNALSSETPQQSLAFEAVGRRSCAPDDEVVRSRTRYWVNQSLHGLLVDVLLLHNEAIQTRTHRNGEQSPKVPSNNLRFQAGDFVVCEVGEDNRSHLIASQLIPICCILILFIYFDLSGCFKVLKGNVLIPGVRGWWEFVLTSHPHVF